MKKKNETKKESKKRWRGKGKNTWIYFAWPGGHGGEMKDRQTNDVLSEKV